MPRYILYLSQTRYLVGPPSTQNQVTGKALLRELLAKSQRKDMEVIQAQFAF